MKTRSACRISRRLWRVLGKSQQSTSEDTHVPCAIGGKITISFLRKGQAGPYATILKEIEACPIAPEQKVEGISWKGVRELIQTHEWNLLRVENPDGTKELLPARVLKTLFQCMKT